MAQSRKRLTKADWHTIMKALYYGGEWEQSVADSYLGTCVDPGFANARNAALNNVKAFDTLRKRFITEERGK